MEPEKQAKKGSTLRRTTLAELGPNLPIGFRDDKTGQLSKSFDVRKWRMPEEKAAGKLRSEYRGKNAGQYVSALLSKMCPHMGPHKLETMKDEERLLVFNQMYMSDVLYAYIWLRYRASGPKLPMDPLCPFCREEFAFEGLLESLEIVTLDDIEDAFWEYELFEPITIRGKEVKRLKIGPPRWNMIESANEEMLAEFNTGAVKCGLIYGSVTAIEGVGEIPLGPNELDDMVKYDIEQLTAEMDRRAVGPIMVLEGICPAKNCKRKFKIPISWTTEDFFSTSSR